MILRGYDIVRPGHERAVRIAVAAAGWGRACAYVLAVAAGVATAIVVHVLLVPLATAPDDPWYVTATHALWPFALALVPICVGGPLAASAIDRWAERVISTHLRSAFALYDWFGGMPDVPVEELWAVMDRYETEGSAAFADLPAPGRRRD